MCSSLGCFEQCAQKGTTIESLGKIVEMWEVLGFYILTDQSVKEILTLTSEEMLRLGAELYIISQEECFCINETDEAFQGSAIELGWPFKNNLPHFTSSSRESQFSSDSPSRSPSPSWSVTSVTSDPDTGAIFSILPSLYSCTVKVTAPQTISLTSVCSKLLHYFIT